MRFLSLSYSSSHLQILNALPRGKLIHFSSVPPGIQLFNLLETKHGSLIYRLRGRPAAALLPITPITQHLNLSKYTKLSITQDQFHLLTFGFYRRLLAAKR